MKNVVFVTVALAVAVASAAQSPLTPAQTLARRAIGDLTAAATAPQP
jgi:hypothetical protein